MQQVRLVRVGALAWSQASLGAQQLGVGQFLTSRRPFRSTPMAA
jgi:hypothetical protein